MANSFNTQPIYLDTDTSTGGNTNWRGTSGCTLNPGNLPSTLQQSAPVSRTWGIKPWMIVVQAASGSVPTVVGNIVVTDPQSTGGAGQLFKCAIESTSQFPLIFTSGFSSLWRDFVVTGLTATACSIQVFYRM